MRNICTKAKSLEEEKFFHLNFYLPKSKLAWGTQQASSMHLRHEITLLDTPMPFLDLNLLD